jgi:hypothetical protein
MTDTDKASNVTIDLTILGNDSGSRYEDRYGAYIKIFERIATAPANFKVTVINAPYSWVPLLYHLNCHIASYQVLFEYDARVKGALAGGSDWSEPVVLDRSEVEILCSFRPETADALWKIDMQWSCPRGRVRQYEPMGGPAMRPFMVTTNGAFHRPEVLWFGRRLQEYVPSKRKVVLVPCAADKPYPAPMHQAVLDIMPADYYMMNVTGVLGLVPQDLWKVMPHYDSGIPNRWRVQESIAGYFSNFEHDHIVIYSDFYGEAIALGLMRTPNFADRKATFVIKPKFRPDYLDLMNEKYLSVLKGVFEKGLASPQVNDVVTDAAQ